MRVFVLIGVLLAGYGYAASALAQASPTFYSYENRSGRTVYVNRFSLVPPEKRSEARAVDLSAIELHGDLAEDLAEAVEDELRFLKESDPCQEARREKIAGTWRHVLNRHGGWILASFGALVLLLITPWMVARTPPGAWSRLLMVALPALAMTAFLINLLHQQGLYPSSSSSAMPTKRKPRRARRWFDSTRCTPTSRNSIESNTSRSRS